MSTASEYSPDTSKGENKYGRRTFLGRTATGVGLALGLPAILAACDFDGDDTGDDALPQVYEVPKDELERAVLNTMDNYEALMNHDLIKTSEAPHDIAAILAGVLGFKPSVEDAVGYYRAFHDSDESLYYNGRKPNDTQLARLAAIADASTVSNSNRQEVFEKVVHDFNEVFKTIQGHAYYPNPLGIYNPLENSYDLAIQITTLGQIPGIKVEDLYETVKKFVTFKTNGNQHDELQEATGVILIARIMQQLRDGNKSIGSVFKPGNVIWDNTSYGIPGEDLAVLDLAAQFIPTDPTQKTIREIYSKFTQSYLAYQEYNAAMLTLGAVLPGYDNSKAVEDIYEFARHEKSERLQGSPIIDDDSAAELSLITLLTTMRTSRMPRYMSRLEANPYHYLWFMNLFNAVQDGTKV